MTPTSIEIAAWLGCLLFIVGLANQLATLKEKILGKSDVTEISPQPLSVRAIGDPVMEKDCVDRHQTLQNQISELRRQRNEDLVKSSDSRARIYEQINLVRKEIAEMERRLSTADETRSRLMHERVNQILRELGELSGIVKGISKHL